MTSEREQPRLRAGGSPPDPQPPPLPTPGATCGHKCSVEHVVFTARALSCVNKVVKFKGKSGWDPRGCHPDIIAGGGACAEQVGGGSWQP